MYFKLDLLSRMLFGNHIRNIKRVVESCAGYVFNGGTSPIKLTHVRATVRGATREGTTQVNIYVSLR